MAGGIKRLAKETAVYGISSILGRFLNWCFVFLYINVLKTTAEYGIVTNLYAYMALLLIILTYGLETGFFRFANDKNCNDPAKVYTTGLISLAATSTLFFIIVIIFLQPASSLLGYPDGKNCIWMLALIIAMDAFTSLPFAYLRYKQRAIRFASLKLISIALNIILNLLFFLVCPAIYKTNPALISWFFSPERMVEYIFVSNLISSAVTMLLLLPEITGIHYHFDRKLWRRMLRYSFPLLILGIAGIMNQTFDKMFYPLLAEHRPDYMGELGIYGATYKIAIVMVMFTQAFRFAYEPFIFAKNREDNAESRTTYASAMKYFIIFTFFIFLTVMFYIDIVKVMMPAKYIAGIKVVPIVMAGEIFFGVFYNLSLWYKLTDKTQWGAWFSIGGFIVTAAINIAFVPLYGYMACAWGAFFCYLIMMLASYIIGQHYFPIKYDLKKIGAYAAITIILYLTAEYITIDNIFIKYTFRTALLCIFIVYTVKRDMPLKEIGSINKLRK
ncbi:MAG: oligosaccharide flippase family protein [Bacteroidales bacterium]